jgi:16S rRNA (guanine527-N7)-methyltransferase
MTVTAEVEQRVAEALATRYPAAAEGLTAYVALLAGAGVERGLIGPRETERLWSRHVANCAVLEELVAPDAHVGDVGSGAGLPGIPLALVRPDLRVTLVEPLLRRATFLSEAVAELGLDERVEVARSRAEDQRDLALDVVTARAVAALDKLAGWSLPLVRVGGELLALKGSSAADEVLAAQDALERLGGGQAEVLQCGHGVVDPPSTVVRVVRLRPDRPDRRRRGTRSEEQA